MASTPPLTPAVFHILLVLSSGERHGYGIMKQVEADSQGKVNMGTGTLYGSLKRMLDAGLVAESDKRVDPEMDDERRIYYQITGAGQKALAAELERYERIVMIAQERKLFPKTFAYDVSSGSNTIPQNEIHHHKSEIPGADQPDPRDPVHDHGSYKPAQLP